MAGLGSFPCLPDAGLPLEETLVCSYQSFLKQSSDQHLLLANHSLLLSYSGALHACRLDGKLRPRR